MNDPVEVVGAGGRVLNLTGYVGNATGASNNTVLVTGSGSVISVNQDVTGINVSLLNNGTLTFSVKLTDLAGNIGTAASATTTLGQ